MMSLMVVCYSCLFITELDKSEQNGIFKWPSCFFFVFFWCWSFLSYLDVDKGQEAGVALLDPRHEHLGARKHTGCLHLEINNQNKTMKVFLRYWLKV